MRIAEYTEATEDVGAAIWIYEVQGDTKRLLQRFESATSGTPGCLLMSIKRSATSNDQ